MIENFRKSKSDREGQISYDIAYMWNLKNMVQMSQFAGQKLRHRCREWTYGHQGGRTAVRWGWWCAELGDWD